MPKNYLAKAKAKPKASECAERTTRINYLTNIEKAKRRGRREIIINLKVGVIDAMTRRQRQREKPSGAFSKPTEIADDQPRAVRAGHFNDTSWKNIILRRITAGED